MHWDSNYSETRPGYKDKAKWGRVGRVGPGLGRGWVCVGIQFNYSKWGRADLGRV